MTDWIERIVIEGVDDMFAEAHKMVETKTGDITPEQMQRLHKIHKDLTELIEEQVKQNL